MHRSIILAAAGDRWIYSYLFAKKDRDNIADDELKAFRKLADVYSAQSSNQLKAALEAGELVEICNEQKWQVQE